MTRGAAANLLSVATRSPIGAMPSVPIGRLQNQVPNHGAVVRCEPGLAPDGAANRTTRVALNLIVRDRIESPVGPMIRVCEFDQHSLMVRREHDRVGIGRTIGVSRGP